MVSFWCWSDRDSDLIRSVLSLAVQFWLLHFCFRSRCTVLDLSLHTFLLWCVGKQLKFWCSRSMLFPTVSWLLLWCTLLELILMACNCEVDLVWGLSPPSLLLCLHAHFLQSQYALVSRISQFVGMGVRWRPHQYFQECLWLLSVQIVFVGGRLL